MTQYKLLTCPFCGSGNTGVESNRPSGFLYGVCRDCGATGPCEDHSNDAEDYCNRRTAVPQSQSLLSDEEIESVYKELFQGSPAKWEGSLRFAHAIESKVRQQDEEMRRDAKAFQDIREHFMIFSYQNGMVSVWGFDGKKVQEFFDSYDITVRGVDSGRDAAFKAIDAAIAKQKWDHHG